MNIFKNHSNYQMFFQLKYVQAEAPNVDCLPTLTLTDIPVTKERFVPKHIGKNLHFQETSGSGLTYCRGVIELDSLTPDEIDLLPVYEAVLTRIGRGGYDYREIGVEQDLSSGGFSVSAGILTDYNRDDIARPSLSFSTYGLDSKLERIGELLDTLLLADGPNFNAERIKVQD